MSKQRSPGHEFILANVGYSGEDCLLWPFSISTPGYGQFQVDKVLYLAHRYMCELVKGPPPEPTHHAAHSCGNRRCVNPGHLSWKTPTENQLDRRVHGTNNKRHCKLTAMQAAQIRGLKGVETSVETAARYGVTESNVRLIQDGKTWPPERKIIYWTPEEDQKLKEAIKLKYSFTQAAAHVGRSAQAVTVRAYKLGLRSGWRGAGGISREERARLDRLQSS